MKKIKTQPLKWSLGISSHINAHSKQNQSKKRKITSLKAVFSFLIIVLSVTSLSYFSPTPVKSDEVIHEWVVGFGGTGSDNGLVVVDDIGSSYVTGGFANTVDFDPGTGTSNLVSNGSTDTYVSKLDSNGDFIWAKSFGSTGADTASALNLDSDNNVYITGRFTSTVDFDPGPGVFNLTAVGFIDVYVVKLDLNGDFIWAKSFGGTSQDFSEWIIVNSAGDIFIVGRFTSAIVDFDPGPEVFNAATAGGFDAYILKLQSNGDFVWVKTFGGTGRDAGEAIFTDSMGNIYSTGSFEGTVDFDPGVGTFNLSSNGSSDTFVQKLDSNGDFVWAKSYGGTGGDGGSAIEVDSSSNLIVTGSYALVVDFDPGIGTFNLSSNGGSDTFVQKLDSNGDFVWAKSMGSIGTDLSAALKIDTDSNVFSVGLFEGTVDFDPGIGTFNLISSGSFDIYIQKLDSNGDFVWAKSFGGTGSDSGSTLMLDTESNVILSGSFSGTVNFDPETETSILVSNGGTDAFVLKLSPVTVPELAPPTTTNVSTSQATLSSNITSTGGVDPTERGFEYGTTISYGSSVGEISVGYDTGAFSYDITGLSCGTLYYYRAFAVNTAGTGYSTGATFSTPGCSSSGSTSRRTRNSNESLSYPTNLSAVESVPVFRLYNPTIKNHFYTTNPNEKQSVLSIGGYRDEGVLGHVLPNSANGATAIYRLYSARDSDHFYTKSVEEKTQALSRGYIEESILGYSDSSITNLEVYRLYNSDDTNHFYTSSRQESESAIVNLKYVLEAVYKWLVK